MSAEWPLVLIDEIKAKNKNAITIGPFGSRMKSDCYVGSGVPVIRGTNLGSSSKFINEFVYITEEKADELSSCNVYKDDLVFPHRGSIGEVGIVDDEQRYVLSSSLMKLTCDPSKAFPKFIYYYFKSSIGRHELLKNSSQVGTPGIGQPLTSLKSIQFRLPPLSAQKQIARVLGSLDEKIQLNHQINQTLEQIAQALFKSWFVDFEPVKAKMAAKARWLAIQPSAESASPVCYADELEPEAGAADLETYMNLAAMQAISGKTRPQLAQLQAEQPEQYAQLQATAALFPAAMHESELGEIPEGWELSQIGDEVTIVGGGTPSTKHPQFWDGGDIHWTTPKDLSNISDKVLIDTERRITATGLAKISSGLLPVDTVLMSSRAPVGYLALAKTPVAINQGYIAMKCEKILTPEYAIQWCEANMDEIKSRASGTTFAEISKKNFKEIKAIRPPEACVLAYSEKVKLLYQQIESRVRESRELAQLRDTLLPKLLSGELTLPEAEQQAQEASGV